MGKTNSLNDNDLKELVERQASYVNTENQWVVDASRIDQASLYLSVKIQNTPEEASFLDPEDITA